MVARKLNFLHLNAVTHGSIVMWLILRHFVASDLWEGAGFVTGVVGVYLVAVEHIINWPVGLANVAIYAWVFFTSRLYADMSLQFFFFALGVQGWWQWAKGKKGVVLERDSTSDAAGWAADKTTLPITRIAPIYWLLVVLSWALGTAIYYPIIRHFNGAAPFVDSSLTVSSIIAQLLLNVKKLENWIIWITVDVIYIPLYISRHLVVTAVLYSLLLALAIWGLVGWRKTFVKQLTLDRPTA